VAGLRAVDGGQRAEGRQRGEEVGCGWQAVDPGTGTHTAAVPCASACEQLSIIAVPAKSKQIYHHHCTVSPSAALTLKVTLDAVGAEGRERVEGPIHTANRQSVDDGTGRYMMAIADATRLSGEEGQKERRAEGQRESSSSSSSSVPGGQFFCLTNLLYGTE
jgi:hypothetical protein